MSRPSIRRYRPGLAFVFLAALMLLLLLAGGASRENVLGQAVVRAGAWMAIVGTVLFTHGPLRGNRAIWLILLSALAIPLLQLVPLPPIWWQELPGREFILQAPLAGPQPWRPLSLSPGATLNAAGALVVPMAVLILLGRLRDADRTRLPALLIVMAGFSLLLGLLQFSGAGIGNPFINDSPGEVGGPFANRNHFALFLAITCLVAPVWALSDRTRSSWTVPVALGISILSVLTILATGSRAGLLLGGLAAGLAVMLSWRDVRRMLRRQPRWVSFAAVAGVVVVIALLLILSVSADRAVSIDRLFATRVGQDMRGRGLSTVTGMVATYFPFGTGVGSFDPAFRLHEPFELLKRTYFNHAHNDMLEITLDAGIIGMVVLAGALAWWAWASVGAWRRGNRLSQLGSAILLLVIVASVVDYPARTPLILAIMTIASVWLDRRALPATALPHISQPL